ncbi:MAG TPA: hypothetical protein VH540_27055 [Ktedonobacterales bacterium]|jgi:hypothetical protein
MARDKQYTERLDIPLTPTQLASLRARAEAMGLPTTTYARMVLFTSGQAQPLAEQPQHQPQGQAQPEPRQFPTAIELLKLPPEERDKILEEQAILAEELYRTDRDLTGFEAFGEDDLYDEYPETEQG